MTATRLTEPFRILPRHPVFVSVISVSAEADAFGRRRIPVRPGGGQLRRCKSAPVSRRLSRLIQPSAEQAALLFRYRQAPVGGGRKDRLVPREVRVGVPVQVYGHIIPVKSDEIPRDDGVHKCRFRKHAVSAGRENESAVRNSQMFPRPAWHAFFRDKAVRVNGDLHRTRAGLYGFAVRGEHGEFIQGPAGVDPVGSFRPDRVPEAASDRVKGDLHLPGDRKAYLVRFAADPAGPVLHGAPGIFRAEPCTVGAGIQPYRTAGPAADPDGIIRLQRAVLIQPVDIQAVPGRFFRRLPCETDRFISGALFLRTLQGRCGRHLAYGAAGGFRRGAFVRPDLSAFGAPVAGRMGMLRLKAGRFAPAVGMAADYKRDHVPVRIGPVLLLRVHGLQQDPVHAVRKADRLAALRVGAHNTVPVPGAVRAHRVDIEVVMGRGIGILPAEHHALAACPAAPEVLQRRLFRLWIGARGRRQLDRRHVARIIVVPFDVIPVVVVGIDDGNAGRIPADADDRVLVPVEHGAALPDGAVRSGAFYTPVGRHPVPQVRDVGPGAAPVVPAVVIPAVRAGVRSLDLGHAAGADALGRVVGAVPADRIIVGVCRVVIAFINRAALSLVVDIPVRVGRACLGTVAAVENTFFRRAEFGILRGIFIRIDGLLRRPVHFLQLPFRAVVQGADPKQIRGVVFIRRDFITAGRGREHDLVAEAAAGDVRAGSGIAQIVIVEENPFIYKQGVRTVISFNDM